MYRFWSIHDKAAWGGLRSPKVARTGTPLESSWIFLSPSGDLESRIVASQTLSVRLLCWDDLAFELLHMYILHIDICMHVSYVRVPIRVKRSPSVHCGGPANHCTAGVAQIIGKQRISWVHRKTCTVAKVYRQIGLEDSKKLKGASTAETTQYVQMYCFTMKWAEERLWRYGGWPHSLVDTTNPFSTDWVELFIYN